ncbi:hypothetical protein FJY68_04510 [candidate division WOR-3 bacterium]|uniref:Uncharacterized protein n=1 Tax=candidate division WOR-3 bacterium TaxID=2052148 RepID=A0A937XCE1_UNCW3|nr:hypothetical protein [candidate division WOR-3 bacterium]
MPDDIALAATWHPRGETQRLARAWRRISETFRAVSIVVPSDVHSAQLADQVGAVRQQISSAPNWSRGRYEALRLAVASGASAIEYVDMDHLLRWIETRPDELHRVTETAAHTPFVVIGRSEQAYSTYPLAIRETERPINSLFSHIFGQEMDLCAATRRMSRDIAGMLLRESSSDATFGVDTEWPAIAFRRGVKLEYVEVDGLDWESADQYQDTAADAARQSRLAALYDRDPEKWSFRVRAAEGMIRAGLTALGRCRCDEPNPQCHPDAAGGY